MQERPLYWTSLGLTLGMVTSHMWIGDTNEVGRWTLLIVALFVWYAFRTHSRKSCLLLLVVGGIGFCYYSLYDKNNQTALSASGEELRVEGEMITGGIIDGDRVKFLLRVNNVNGVPLEETVDCYVPLQTQNELMAAQKLRPGVIFASRLVLFPRNRQGTQVHLIIRTTFILKKSIGLPVLPPSLP